MFSQSKDFEQGIVSRKALVIISTKKKARLKFLFSL
jgi:hypothetical protein